MAEETDVEKCNLRNFRSPMTLTLTVDRVIQHTIVHQSSTSIYIPDWTEIGKKFCKRMDVRTDGHMDVPTGHFRPPIMLLNRLGGVDLIIINTTNQLHFFTVTMLSHHNSIANQRFCTYHLVKLTRNVYKSICNNSSQCNIYSTKIQLHREYMPKTLRTYLGTSFTGILSTVCEKRWFCRLCNDSSSWRYREGPLPKNNKTLKQ